MKIRLTAPLIAVVTAAWFSTSSTNAAPEVNWALTGTPAASSEGFGGVATLAVDGNVAGAFPTYHSGVVDDAPTFWEVDLGSEKAIGRVALWLRTDCCLHRNQDLTLKVLKADRSEVLNHVFAGDPRQYNPPFVAGLTEYALVLDLVPAINGQIIRVENVLSILKDADSWLQLAEVQAIAPYENVTINVTVPLPASISGVENETVTVGPVTGEVVGAEQEKLKIQWQKNGVDIPGANGASYTTPLLKMTDQGAKYGAKLTVPGVSKVSEATLNLSPDVTPPTILSVGGGDTFTSVTVVYSEEVTAATAGNTANYAIDGGLTVSAVTAVSPTTVKLTTSRQTAGTVYNVTINNIKDTAAGAGNTIAANTKASFTAFVLASGAVGFDAYNNITGTAVDGLTGDPKFPDSPDFVGVSSSMDTRPVYPDDSHENYGGRLRALLTPTEAGDYEFFLRSDDASQLFLSSDESFDPAKLAQIAEEIGCCDAYHESGDPETSTPINLQAGKQYAIQVLWKEGGGGDYAQVAWRKAGDATAAANLTPIPGRFFSWYVSPDGVSIDFVQQPKDVQLLEGLQATFSVVVNAKSALGTNANYQWKKNGANIAGANSASFVTAPLLLADSGAKYSVEVSVPTLSKISSEATATVQADAFAPKVFSVTATGLESLIVGFDEKLDKASAEAAANYSLSDGITVSKAVLGSSGNTVLLTTAGLTSGKQYTLTVGGIKDLFNNVVPAGTTFQFVARVVSYADIILADNPIAFYRFEETSGSVAKNSGSTGGDGVYTVGDETGPKEGGAPGAAKGDPGPRPADFLGFASDNRAATLDGVGDWIDTRNQFLQNRAAFTLEYWVKPARTNEAGEVWPNRVGIVGQNDAIEYGFITPGTIQIWTPGGGSLDTAYPFPDGQWHHVATIADGRNLKNYFDGVLVGTGGSATGNYGAADFNVHIGGGGVFDGSGNWFTGQIDEVAIFDRAIPAERVAAHFKAGKEGGTLPEPAGSTFTGISVQGANVVFTWSGDGTLQSADAVTGPYADVAGATSPRTVPVANGPKYYRFKP